MRWCTAYYLVVVLPNMAVVHAFRHHPDADASQPRPRDYWTTDQAWAAQPLQYVVDAATGVRLQRAPVSVYHDESSPGPAQGNALVDAGGHHRRGLGHNRNTAATITLVTPTDQASLSVNQVDFAVTISSSILDLALFVNRNGNTGGYRQFYLRPARNDQYMASVSFPAVNATYTWYVAILNNNGKVSTSGTRSFTVTADSSNNDIIDGTTVVSDGAWTLDSVVKNATGRLLFTQNGREYLCSASVIHDGGRTDRSLILTAAHCVYDALSGSFADNVLFIPNQDDTTGVGTDSVCSNDPFGCWEPSFAIVDRAWSTLPFPENSVADYAILVVDNANAHQPGWQTVPDALDAVAQGGLKLYTNGTNVTGTFTYAIGYGYQRDPDLRFCGDHVEVMTTTPENDKFWWLPTCEMMSGSSGGPWVQHIQNSNKGVAHVVSVVSWSYANAITGQELPGGAGPFLYDNSAACVYEAARQVSLTHAAALRNGGLLLNYNDNCAQALVLLSTTSSSSGGDDGDGGGDGGDGSASQCAAKGKLCVSNTCCAGLTCMTTGGNAFQCH